MSRKNKSQDYYDEPLDDDFDEYSRPRKRNHPRQEQYQPRTRGNGGSWLLIGCATIIVMIIAFAVVSTLKMTGNVPAGSIGIGGTSKPIAYTQQSQQPLPQLSTITQLQVHNVVGNVSIIIGPTTTTAMVTTVKKVKAVSKDEANKEFGRISIQASTTGNSFIISVSLPTTNGSILNKDGDSVDMTITLPPSVNANSTAPPLTLKIDTSTGNVLVNGLNGVLMIKNGIGNVTVQGATLADGSHLETSTGNVVFAGSLDASSGSKPDPCGNPGGDFHPLYKFQSETGNVDVTLLATTNVVLDANVNQGMIKSDFSISVANTGGSPSYCGPLLSNQLTQPGAVLVLDVSSGDIILHKV